MLILSIVLAAMAPVMTTRYKSKPNNASPWLYDSNNRNNIWFGAAPAQHAMIGQNSYGADDTIAKLLITVGDDTTNFLAFKRNNTNIGRLFIGGTNLLLGNLESGTLGDGSVGVGRNLQTGANSTAVGSSTNASGANAVAVGSSVTAGNSGSIAIGTSTNASADNAIAIGNSAYTRGTDTLVIGNNANIKYQNSPNRDSAGRSDGSIVIGNASSVLYDQKTSKNVVVIGNGAKADAPLQLNGDGVIAIGENARAKQEGAIALGKGAEADGYYVGGNLAYASAIAIGHNAKVLNGNKSYKSIAIGNGASVLSGSSSIALGSEAEVDTSGSSSIAIGNKSNAKSDYSIALGNGVNTRWGDYDSYYWGLPTQQKENFSSGEMSIAIGVYSYAKGSNSIAIGSLESFSSQQPHYPYSGGVSSIAIGTGAQSAGEKSVAIGYNAAATNNSGIAIGNGAKVYANNSVAIGQNVVNNRESVIQLGNPTDTVYIPGRLIVGNKSFFGANLSGDDLGVAGQWGNGGVRAWIGDLSGERAFDIYWDPPNIPAEAGYDGAFKWITSDRRLKYVGKENTSGLDKIRQLKVFNYTFKKDTKKEPHVGVIAQDLQKVFPNAVKKGADGFLTIRMEDMFYAVINAIKELDAKYQAQEKRINELEKRIEKLEAKAK